MSNDDESVTRWKCSRVDGEAWQQVCYSALLHLVTLLLYSVTLLNCYFVWLLCCSVTLLNLKALSSSNFHPISTPKNFLSLVLHSCNATCYNNLWKTCVLVSRVIFWALGSGCVAPGLILKEGEGVQSGWLKTCADPTSQLHQLHGTKHHLHQLHGTKCTKHQTPSARNTMHHRWKCTPPIDAGVHPRRWSISNARCRQSRSPKVRTNQGNAEKNSQSQKVDFFFKCRKREFRFKCILLK